MDNTHKTMLWWRILSAIAVVNILLWCVLAWSVEVTSDPLFWQLTLSGIYTAVCAFRSFFPRIDLERYCLFDSFLSSAVLGRSAATIAEVSFAAQVALLLYEVGGAANVLWLQQYSPLVVLSLSLAQIFCWSGVLTLNHIGHAIEESLWGLTFAMVAISLAFCLPALTGLWWWVSVCGVAISTGYVAFMFLVDVPMYVERMRTGQKKKERYLGWREGFSDALHRRVVTRSWTVWKPEVAWLTGYFSGAVWVSHAIVWIPRC